MQTLVCLLSQCLVQNVRFQGLSKKGDFTFVNEHFFAKRNEENGYYGQTLINLV